MYNYIVSNNCVEINSCLGLVCLYLSNCVMEDGDLMYDPDDIVKSENIDKQQFETLTLFVFQLVNYRCIWI